MSISGGLAARPLAFAQGSAIGGALMNHVMQTRSNPLVRANILDLQGDVALAALSRLAARDIADGLRLWRLASTLAWLDIRLRYRGSILGPFWLTLSTAIMVGSLGVLYSTLFHTDVHEYLPFLALSQVLWGLLSTLVMEASTCFTQAEGMIRAVRMPLTLHAVRLLVRNVLVFAHNIVVIVAVDIIFSIWPGWHAFLALPGLAIWGVDGLAVALLLGAFCARFRDIGPIIGSIMMIAFFLTPVIWQPAQLGSHAALLPYNPFFALLEVVRAPLLGHIPSADTWIAAVLYSVVLCGASWALFVRARGRVAFWI
jgi:lipopolysaccharide transport system permease protein